MKAKDLTVGVFHISFNSFRVVAHLVLDGIDYR